MALLLNSTKHLKKTQHQFLFFQKIEVERLFLIHSKSPVSLFETKAPQGKKTVDQYTV